MAKPRKTYVCQACGSVSNRWQGQCPDCAEWNTLVEQAAPTAFSARHDLQTGGQRIQLARLDAAVELPPRISTGIEDRKSTRLNSSHT